jgi:YHS domain-containing protein
MHRIALFIVTVVLTGGAAFAGPSDAKVTNKMCPLMGEAVDPAVRMEHEGQYVYFCCKMCVGEFKKDPAKAINELSAEDRAAIKKNETCPVSGEKINDWSHRMEKDGKLVYFCCPKCKGNFEKGGR